jgi:hypothetical protein
VVVLARPCTCANESELLSDVLICSILLLMLLLFVFFVFEVDENLAWVFKNSVLFVNFKYLQEDDEDDEDDDDDDEDDDEDDDDDDDDDEYEAVDLTEAVDLITKPFV